MDKLIVKIIELFIASGLTAMAVITLVFCFPEKVEKWAALFWKVVLQFGIALRIAHKRYIQHDIQASINDFLKMRSKDTPGFQVQGVKLEWVDAELKKKAFIDKGAVVVRVKRDDPHHENFVRAVYFFVATSLLYRAKRYISPSQGQAIDLFVTTQLFREEKPEVVSYFVEEYLHRTLDDHTKIAGYFERFDTVEKAGLFFPVFLQELDYLGEKVFGNRRLDKVVVEVDEMLKFLEAISSRRVGDDTTDLNFVRQYCKFAIIIVGKSFKVAQSIAPYVNFVRKLEKSTETVYLIGRAENESSIKKVATELGDIYSMVSERTFRQTVI